MNISLFFYLRPEIWNENIKIYSVIGSIPGLTITFILESFYQKFHKTRYLISITGTSLMVITIFTPEIISTTISNGYILVLGVFFISFFITLIKGSSGSLRKNIIIFTIAFFMFAFGEIILNPRVIDAQINAGEDIISSGVLGHILRIISLFLMAAVLFEQPIFYELNWRDNIIQLFVIHKNDGIPLLHQKFRELHENAERKKELTESFIAGGITGIAVILKEISQSSKDLKVIDHGDQKILLEHGDQIYLAANVVEELDIFWDKLRKIRTTIERIYGGILRDFDGNLKVFKPLENLIEKEFS